MQAVEGAENPQRAVNEIDSELGVSEWWTPLHTRRPEHVGPRVTEDGLKVPSWWRDEETESQQWLASQGVMIDA